MKKNSKKPKPHEEDIAHRPFTAAEWKAAGPPMHGIDGLPKELREAVLKTIGRPKSARPKKPISFRFSADIVDHLKEDVVAYNGRVEAMLREAIAEGRI